MRSTKRWSPVTRPARTSSDSGIPIRARRTAGRPRAALARRPPRDPDARRAGQPDRAAGRRDALSRGGVGDVAARRLSGALQERRGLQPQAAAPLLAVPRRMGGLRCQRPLAEAALAAARAGDARGDGTHRRRALARRAVAGGAVGVDPAGLPGLRRVRRDGHVRHAAGTVRVDRRARARECSARTGSRLRAAGRRHRRRRARQGAGGAVAPPSGCIARTVVAREANAAMAALVRRRRARGHRRSGHRACLGDSRGPSRRRGLPQRDLLGPDGEPHGRLVRAPAPVLVVCRAAADPGRAVDPLDAVLAWPAGRLAPRRPRRPAGADPGARSRWSPSRW